MCYNCSNINNNNKTPQKLVKLFSQDPSLNFFDANLSFGYINKQ